MHRNAGRSSRTERAYSLTKTLVVAELSCVESDSWCVVRRSADAVVPIRIACVAPSPALR